MNKLATRSETSSLSTRDANRTPAIRLAVSLLVLAGASVYLFSHGMLLLSAFVAFICLVPIFRFISVRTSRHEQAQSLRDGSAQSLEELKSKLRGFQLDPPLKAASDLALLQLQQVETGLRQAEQAMSEKLDPGELTYSRFADGLRFGAGAIVANVKEAVENLQQASGLGSRTAAAEVPTSRAQAILSENTPAIEKLNDAVSALVKMNTDAKRPELTEAIHSLEQIAARANKISLKSGDN